MDVPRITTVVSWDLTSVEGVSGGLTMNYTDEFGKVTVAGPRTRTSLGALKDKLRDTTRSTSNDKFMFPGTIKRYRLKPLSSGIELSQGRGGLAGQIHWISFEDRASSGNRLRHDSSGQAPR